MIISTQSWGIHGIKARLNAKVGHHHQLNECPKLQKIPLGIPRSMD